jgi:hypothetical protein
MLTQGCSSPARGCRDGGPGMPICRERLAALLRELATVAANCRATTRSIHHQRNAGRVPATRVFRIGQELR